MTGYFTHAYTCAFSNSLAMYVKHMDDRLLHYTLSAKALSFTFRRMQSFHAVYSVERRL